MSRSFKARYNIEDNNESDNAHEAKFLMMQCITLMNDILDSVAKTLLPQYVIQSIKDPVLRWTILINYINLETGDIDFSHSLSGMKNIRNKLHHGKTITSIDIQMFYVGVHKMRDRLNLSRKTQKDYDIIKSNLQKVITLLNIEIDVKQLKSIITEELVRPEYSSGKSWYKVVKIDPEVVPLASFRRSSDTIPPLTLPQRSSDVTMTTTTESFVPSSMRVPTESFVPSSMRVPTDEGLNYEKYPTLQDTLEYLPTLKPFRPSLNGIDNSERIYDYDAVGKMASLDEIRNRYGAGAKGVEVEMVDGLHRGRVGRIGKYNGANIFIEYDNGNGGIDRRSAPKHNRVIIRSVPFGVAY